MKRPSKQCPRLIFCSLSSVFFSNLHGNPLKIDVKIDDQGCLMPELLRWIGLANTNTERLLTGSIDYLPK